MFPGDCSEYGVGELSGNLNEWTRTPYPYRQYPFEIGGKPEEPGRDGGRAVRGGSFQDEAGGWPRCSGRSWGVPYLGHVSAGFRVVVVPMQWVGGA
jgi:formylglycine-generating enzyme required for sulfatase activity